ncbi:MAG: ROK family protein [Trueperaceae bacterium]|nr:ROK family protein [Trueperaceae bacterium]
MKAAVVIDMGGTSLKFGHLLNEKPAGMFQSLATEALRRARDPIVFLAEAVKTYTEQQRLEPDTLIIGVPFTPDREMTTALSSPNIRNLEAAPIKQGLEAKLGLRVVLERDINLLLLGEWYAGAARGAGDVLGMFVGTGVGGCFLQQGVPFRGASGGAIELGHIPIRAEGRVCVCGNVDCLEAYACGHTLVALAERYDTEVAQIFEADHPLLKQESEAFVRDLAYAMATAINLFQPDLALVGGGIPAMRSFPKALFKNIFYDHLRKPVPETTVAFSWAELGSEAALWGAVALQKKG